MRFVLMFVVFLCAVPLLAAERPRELALMPQPSKVQLGTGYLGIDRSFSAAINGSHDAVLERGVERFFAALSKQTGILLLHKAGEASHATLQIRAEGGAGEVLKLGEDESYELVINETGAKLTAPTTLGVLTGRQTFIQLWKVKSNGFGVPVVTINDEPRFAWRGLLFDMGRHFIPVDVLKR